MDCERMEEQLAEKGGKKNYKQRGIEEAPENSKESFHSAHAKRMNEMNIYIYIYIYIYIMYCTQCVITKRQDIKVYICERNLLTASGTPLGTGLCLTIWRSVWHNILTDYRYINTCNRSGVFGTRGIPGYFMHVWVCAVQFSGRNNQHVMTAKYLK